jgi:hypothetical protein
MTVRSGKYPPGLCELVVRMVAEIRGDHLVAFNESRGRNRELANDPATVKQADATVMTYERYSRSINDPGSLEGRHEVFFKRI